MAKEYFNQKSPVYPAVEGRIKFVNDMESSASEIRSFIVLPFLVSVATVLSTI